MKVFVCNQTTPFNKWIWSNKETRIILLLCLIASLVQFVWFKVVYPFPNFLPDSYSYIEAAGSNQDINLWPVGYSKFIRFISAFTHSDIALALIQYLMLQSTIIYFLLTLVYFFKPGKVFNRILFGVFIINPIFLYVANLVSSDALFTSLSIVWFTQLIWIAHGFSTGLVIKHVVILVLAFAVRYNALYYPLISCIVIVLSAPTTRYRLLGIFLVAIGLGGVIGHTMLEYKKVTGHLQFSAFGGWQMASNALYMYSKIEPEYRNSVPDKFSQIHELTNRHVDSVNQLESRPDSALGPYYLWDEKAPLKAYMSAYWQKDSAEPYFKKWATMSNLYGAYGLNLISSYPEQYFTNYLYPNIINYYVPDVEFLGMYNMGADTVDFLAKDWFAYKSNKVTHRSPDYRIYLTKPYSLLIPMLNVLYVFGVVAFLLSRGRTRSGKTFHKVFWIALAIWVANLFFSVLASPIVLRYQLFPMVLTLAFSVLFIQYILSLDIVESLVPESKGEVAVSV